MTKLSYLAVLAGCLGCAIWLEPVFRVNVLRRWRRLLLTLLPVVVVFAIWDLAAITAGHWNFDPAQTTGILLPGALPLEELLFFLVVPFCAILGFEAVRAVRGWSAGDEPSDPVPSGAASAGAESAGADSGSAESAGAAGRPGKRR